jgi:hemolysin activation/secretion protein
MLVSAEQFQAGGAFTVRGYREGQVVGDSGIVLSGEWRVPAFIIPKTWKIPHTEYILRDNVQFVSFVDYGGINVNRPAAGVNRNDNLLGVGIGLRAKLTRFVTGRLDLAFPLFSQLDDNAARLHFGIESNIF